MSKLPFIIAIAAAVIALGFFVYVTDAPAYGGSAPETCANCHVMDSQYENWYHAPHEKFTECVDCHLPHENVVVYYLEKGRQGAKDVYAFTTGNIPVAIRASEKTKGHHPGRIVCAVMKQTVEIHRDGRTAIRPLLLGLSSQCVARRARRFGCPLSGFKSSIPSK